MEKYSYNEKLIFEPGPDSKGRARVSTSEGDVYVATPEQGSHGHTHASCIVETPEGNLLAVWYENGPRLDSYYYKDGDWDKSDDVRIGGAWLLKGSDSWEPPFIMADTFGLSDNNPCLAIDKENRLWFFHVTLLAVPMRSWESALIRFRISSEYEGMAPPRWDRQDILAPHAKDLDEIVVRQADRLRRTSSRRNKNNLDIAAAVTESLNDPFTRRLGWMPRVRPYILDDGTLILPLGNENFNLAAMAITTDGGKTWEMSETVPGGGVMQPSIVQLKDGRLVAFFRDAGGTRRIQKSESLDNGRTWSPITLTDLPNPGSGIEAIMLQSGNLAMVYNDKEKGRDSLAISISTDGGQAWSYTKHIEDEEGKRYPYPSVIQTKDGLIHVTYSYNLKAIKHVCFNEAWIME